MSSLKFCDRPGPVRAMKARQAPPKRARAAPEKNTKLVKNSTRKWKPPAAGKGRPKGALNAVTKTAREIFSAFVEGNALKLQQLFDRVAKKNPAKALSIYAKLAEFVIPKLQRTELSGQLNHGLVKELPALEDVSPVEASRIYLEMIHGTATVKFLPSVKPYVAPPPQPKPEFAVPSPMPHQEFIPAAEPPEKRRPENVIVLEHTCSLPEHQPIVDSKCAFCRQLWVKERERAEDAALCHQRPPRVVT
jgi:hypothetical protein